MGILRRPGSPWRIRVHQWCGRNSPHGLPYGRAYDISNNPDAPADAARTDASLHAINPANPPLPDDLRTVHTVLEGTEFDELVVGRWIHLEQMDDTRWWMNVGGVTINVTADRDGRPKAVDVYGPGDYGEAVEGCKYECTWRGGET